MAFLIVQVGNTFEVLRERQGDYDAWFRRGMGLGEDESPVVSPRQGDALPKTAAGYEGVVVTGSAALVTDREPWSEQTAAWLAARVSEGVAVLGVCYGHQLLAHALGGRVDHNPRGRQIGSVQVQLSEAGRRDPLLGELPERHVQQASHVQSVLEPPPLAKVLASTAGDPHHALQLAPRAWGVQFHPEFDDLSVRTYIEQRQERIREEGLDPEALIQQVQPTAHGTTLLRRFVALCRKR